MHTNKYKVPSVGLTCGRGCVHNIYVIHKIVLSIPKIQPNAFQSLLYGNVTTLCRQ